MHENSRLHGKIRYGFKHISVYQIPLHLTLASSRARLKKKSRLNKKNDKTENDILTFQLLPSKNHNKDNINIK